MNIWVDADACPGLAKDIIFRAAERTKVQTTFVANQFLRVPPSPYLRTRQVPKGFDIADNFIVEAAEVGDLVITADIPLAAEAIAKGAHAINPRGERYTKENIGELLNMRDFMDTMRASGAVGGGPPPYGKVDAQAFANQLDRFLAQRTR
jgi:uncharacterized protein